MKNFWKKNWRNILFTTGACVVFVILSVFLFSYQVAINYAFCGAANLNINPLQIYTFDVGQASANLIVLPNKTTIVIDTGSVGSGDKFLSQTRYVLKKNGITKIDYLFISHSDEDHVGGVEKLLKEFQINKIYRPKILSSLSKKETTEEDFLKVDSEIYASAIDAVYSEPNCVVNFISDKSFYIEDVSIYVWAAEKTTYQSANYYSPFIRLEYAGKNYLFTGDATQTRENEFVTKYNALNEDFEIDFLYVSHHGSKYNTGDEFLQLIKPKFAIVSCGQDNYPTRQVVERLNNVGVEKIYSTKESGTIICCESESGTISVTEISFSLDTALIVVLIGLCCLVLIKIYCSNEKNVKYFYNIKSL